MALYNNYPMGYQPYQGYYPQMYQQQMPVQPQVQQMQTQPQPQIQNGGFVSVRSIEEARAWPVAPGNAVTFKIENAPIVCEKSQGFSQFEPPKFDVFKLVKEEPVEPMPVAYQESPSMRQREDLITASDLKPIKEDVERIKAAIWPKNASQIDASEKTEVVVDE